MHKPIIAANWKMNKSHEEATAFFKTFFGDPAIQAGTISTVICPPAPLLHLAKSYLSTPNFYLGGQNLHEQESGAFTGEISASMLKDSGCKVVLVGHSERRHLYGESHTLVAKKAIAAAKAGLTPILCVGETLVDRQGNQTFQVIRSQINALFAETPFMAPLILAYEPVWAIGTGQVATPTQAQEVHAFIRQLLSEYLGDKGRGIPLLYGGSVTPENTESLLGQLDVDGALVGGASLQPDSFLKIVRKASGLSA